MMESLLCIVSVSILFAARKFLMVRPSPAKTNLDKSSN